MKRFLSCQIFISLALLATLFTLHSSLHPILAHGSTGSSKIIVDNEKFGPYILLVATSPSPLTVGAMDVWVRVAEDETDRLLRDAVVRVEATPQSRGATLTAQATHEHAGNAFDYVAHLDLEDSGPWDFTIYVEHELGPVDVAFTDTVAAESNMSLLIGSVIAFVVLAMLLGLYLWRKSAAVT
jgi:hypothetical protein